MKQSKVSCLMVTRNRVELARRAVTCFANQTWEGEEIVKLIRRVARGEYLINENVLNRPFVASRVLDQFRELTPVGAEGDAVVRQLAERLVEIDLLGRAFEE